MRLKGSRREYGKLISKKLIVILFFVGLAGLVFDNYELVEKVETTEPTVLSAPTVVQENSEKEIFELTNSYRKEHDLSTLKLDDGLTYSAREKAVDMCVNNYFSHDRPDGTPFYKVIEKHSNYQSAGENLAKGFDTANEAMVGWKNSPAHNENMLDAKWESLGVGYAICGNGTKYYVQHFKTLKPQL